MELKQPKSENYAAEVIKITKLVDLANCDNVQAAIIQGNSVIVSKEVKEGDMGLFFPLETALSVEFISANNLYRDNTLNNNGVTKGYFENHGRIRAVKFRGNKSEGFFIPIHSLLGFATTEELVTLKVGDTFDEINGIEICRKYVPAGTKIQSNTPGTKKKNKLTEILIEGQFKFHSETPQLKRNLHEIRKESIISITSKYHGSSGIMSNVLIKRKISFLEKLAKKFGCKIKEEEYAYIYSSGKPKSNLPKGIEGSWVNKGVDFYESNIWKDTLDKYKDIIPKGMSIYGEIVGYETGSTRMIQKGYDYGCKEGENKFYIYKITQTNSDGQTIKFSFAQIQQFCTKYDLQPVQCLYYGRAGAFYTCDGSADCNDRLLEVLSDTYNIEKDCPLCKNKVPAEGIVVAIDDLYEDKAFKLKSYRFLEKETKDLDAGIIDLETQESLVSNEEV